MSHSNPDLLMARCLSCGNIHGLDEVHMCNPLSPVPPHAAGEELDDVPTSEAIDEALGWLRDARPDYHATLTRIISHLEASCDCPCPSPAASQAAPEGDMPEWIPAYIADVRAFVARSHPPQPGTSLAAIVFLADRVAELEREVKDFALFREAWELDYLSLAKHRDEMQLKVAELERERDEAHRAYLGEIRLQNDYEGRIHALTTQLSTLLESTT